jgi:hypothetical protein
MPESREASGTKGNKEGSAAWGGRNACGVAFSGSLFLLDRASAGPAAVRP